MSVRTSQQPIATAKIDPSNVARFEDYTKLVISSFKIGRCVNRSIGMAKTSSANIIPINDALSSIALFNINNSPLKISVAYTIWVEQLRFITK